MATIPNTRHWAVLGLTALGIAAMFTGQSEQVILSITTAVGAAFVWDKVEKYAYNGWRNNGNSNNNNGKPASPS
jgi:hypothetical protein